MLVGLQTLSVRKGSELSADGLKSLFTGPELSQLTYLDLSECVLLDDDAVQAFCQWYDIDKFVGFLYERMTSSEN